MAIEKDIMRIPTILQDAARNIEMELSAIKQQNDARWQLMEKILNEVGSPLNTEVLTEFSEMIRRENEEYKNADHRFRDICNRIVLCAEMIKKEEETRPPYPSV